MPDGAWAWEEETRTKRPFSLAASRSQKARRGVDDRAHEQVVQPLVVVEGRGRQRLAPLPAADQVQEAVDAAEALLERRGPLARGPLVEQVDDPGVDPVGVEAEVGDERVEDRLVAVGERQRGAGLGEPGGDDRAEPAAGAGDRDHAPVE